MSLAWSAGAFTSGRYIIQYGFRPMVRVGASLVVVGIIGTLAVSVWSWSWALIPSSAITGLGFGIVLPCLNIVTQDRVSWQQRGVATSMLQFVRTISGTIFVTGLGLILSQRLRADLGDEVSAEVLSTLLDPEKWPTLDPTFVEKGRAALNGAIATIFGLVFVLAVVGAGIAYQFPKVFAKATDA